MQQCSLTNNMDYPILAHEQKYDCLIPRPVVKTGCQNKETETSFITVVAELLSANTVVTELGIQSGPGALLGLQFNTRIQRKIQFFGGERLI